MPERPTLEQPLVSFVIPFYNETEEMLRSCIESILTLPLDAEEREIIVIDDGSDGFEHGLLKTYSDNIQYIRQEHLGLSSARNHGIDLAKGKYIQFIDADDKLIPDNYHQIIELIKTTDNIEIVLFESTRIDSIIKKPLRWRTYSGQEYIKKHNIKAPAWGYIFRKSLMQDLRFTPNILHEDEEFTPKLMLKAKQLTEVNTVAYFYRERKGSITTRQEDDWISNRLDDSLRIIERLQQYASHLEKDKAEALERRIAQLAMDYVHNVMHTQHTFADVEARLTQLKTLGTFPLPLRYYTWKYFLFAIATSNILTRKIIYHLISILKGA